MLYICSYIASPPSQRTNAEVYASTLTGGTSTRIPVSVSRGFGSGKCPVPREEGNKKGHRYGLGDMIEMYKYIGGMCTRNLG